MASQAKVRRLPSLPYHVVCTHHDLIEVLDDEVDVVEPQLAVHVGQRRVRVQQQDVVVVAGAVGAQIPSEPALRVGQAEAQPLDHEPVSRLEVGNGEHHVRDPFRACP